MNELTSCLENEVYSERPPEFFSADYDDITDTTCFGSGRLSATLPVHRDTWASNLMPQINWWAPVMPLRGAGTLRLFPTFFRRPVPNNSKTWSLRALKAARKEGRHYSQVAQ